MICNEDFVSVGVHGSSSNSEPHYTNPWETPIAALPPSPPPALLPSSHVNRSSTGCRGGNGNEHGSPVLISLADSPRAPSTSLLHTLYQDAVSLNSKSEDSSSMNSFCAEYISRAELDAARVQDESDSHPCMSVRPFTPSESFPFPKPPSRPATADNAITNLISLNQPNAFPFRPLTSDAAVTKKTPFNKGNLMSHPKMVDVAIPRHSSSSRQSILMGAPCKHEITSNPFMSQAEIVSNAGDVQNELEMAQFHHVPDMDHELAIAPGDKVRVLEACDDGWAFVEKRSSFGGLVQWETGFIPLACLETGLVANESYSDRALPVTRIGVDPTSKPVAF